MFAAHQSTRPAPPPPIALARMVVQPTPACLKDLTPATLSAVETWVEKVSPVEEESIQVLFSQAIEALLADDKVHVRVGRDRSPFSSQSPSESEEEGLRLRSAQKRLHALLVELATSVLAPLHSMLFPDPALACQHRHLPRPGRDLGWRRTIRDQRQRICQNRRAFCSHRPCHQRPRRKSGRQSSGTRLHRRSSR